MTCETCAYADEHGWFGSNDSHCRGCHRMWRGTAQMHCVQCCHHFTSVSACNKHQATGKCVDPATARNKAGEPIFQTVERYGGPTWALAGSDVNTTWRTKT